MDLSQMLSRLPTESLSDLKAGDAVMVVASQPTPGSPDVSAVTLLVRRRADSFRRQGAAAMNLSPWKVGGGAPDAAAAERHSNSFARISNKRIFFEE